MFILWGKCFGEALGKKVLNCYWRCVWVYRPRIPNAKVIWSYFPRLHLLFLILLQWKTHKSINFYIPNTRCNYSSHKDPYTFTPVALITLFLTHYKGFWGFCCIWPFDQSKLVEWCGSCCFCLPLYPHFGGGVTWPDFSVLNIDPEKIWYKSCNLLVNINNLWDQHVYT